MISVVARPVTVDHEAPYVVNRGTRIAFVAILTISPAHTATAGPTILPNPWRMLLIVTIRELKNRERMKICRTPVPAAVSKSIWFVGRMIAIRPSVAAPDSRIVSLMISRTERRNSFVSPRDFADVIIGTMARARPMHRTKPSCSNG